MVFVWKRFLQVKFSRFFSKKWQFKKTTYLNEGSLSICDECKIGKIKGQISDWAYIKQTFVKINTCKSNGTGNGKRQPTTPITFYWIELGVFVLNIASIIATVSRQ